MIGQERRERQKGQQKSAKGQARQNRQDTADADRCKPPSPVFPPSAYVIGRSPFPISSLPIFRSTVHYIPLPISSQSNQCHALAPLHPETSQNKIMIHPPIKKNPLLETARDTFLDGGRRAEDGRRRASHLTPPAHRRYLAMNARLSAGGQPPHHAPREASRVDSFLATLRYGTVRYYSTACCFHK